MLQQVHEVDYSIMQLPTFSVSKFVNKTRNINKYNKQKDWQKLINKYIANDLLYLDSFAILSLTSNETRIEK